MRNALKILRTANRQTDGFYSYLQPIPNAITDEQTKPPRGHSDDTTSAQRNTHLTKLKALLPFFIIWLAPKPSGNRAGLDDLLDRVG